MPAEVKKEIQLEIAHVLFIDIVGYSKLLTNEQWSLLEADRRQSRRRQNRCGAVFPVANQERVQPMEIRLGDHRRCRRARTAGS